MPEFISVLTLGDYGFDADVYCLAKLIYNVVCAVECPQCQIGDIFGLPKALNDILKQ